MPTATLEEYIEAIYRLGDGAPVRPGQIADAMGVSAPTVTATLGRLAGSGFVKREKGAVLLTDSGLTEALSIVRRHRLAERFLVDTLGLPWDEVHDEACLLEHALSPRVQEALEAFLDNPEYCPHGHPIPGADLGAITPDDGAALDLLSAGSVATILRVTDSDVETVAALASADLGLGTRIEVVHQSRDGSPVLVRSGDREVSLDSRAAAHVVVREDVATE